MQVLQMVSWPFIYFCLSKNKNKKMPYYSEKGRHIVTEANGTEPHRWQFVEIKLCDGELGNDCLAHVPETGPMPPEERWCRLRSAPYVHTLCTGTVSQLINLPERNYCWLHITMLAWMPNGNGESGLWIPSPPSMQDLKKQETCFFLHTVWKIIYN